MAGYSGTPLWRKLGYKSGTRAHVDGAPAVYSALLGMPADVAVEWADRPDKGIGFVHLFETRASRLRSKLRRYRSTIAPDGVLWVSWPKKSSGTPTDLTEDAIRGAALPLGLVDIKVCAVDATWSGLKLVIRMELR